MFGTNERGLLFLGLVVLVLMSLAGTGLGLAGETTEKRIIQTELAQKYWIGDETNLLSPIGERNNWFGYASAKEAENNSSAGPFREIAGAPDVIFQSWRGFALKGNESHSIRVSIESLRPVEAMNIRKLMASNMTLEEIRAEIRKEEGKVIHRGVLKVGSDIFRLDSISMAPNGNKTGLDTDVSLPRFGSSQNNTTTTIGHLNVSLSDEDVGVVSQGILLIKSGKYLGDYRVLLDGQHWDGEMRGGIAGLAMPRRTMMADQGHPFGPPDTS
jgi:hypothetical protein